MRLHHLEPPLLTLLLIAPALAQAHGLLPGLQPFIAILLAFLALFLTPGWLLLRRLSPLGAVGLIEALPLAFALGLSVFAAVGTSAFLLGLSYSLLVDLLAAVSVSLAAWPTSGVLRLRRATRPECLLLLAGILLAGLAFHLGGYQPSGNDTWYHIAKLRRMAGMEGVAETDVMFRGAGISPSYGYNVWHLAAATLARLSSTDAFAAWFYLIPVLVALQLPAYYAFALALFEDGPLAFCATCLFTVLVCLDAQGMSWVAAPVPFPVAYHLLFFPALALAFRAMDIRPPGTKIAAGFVGGSAFAVHAFAPFYVLSAVAGMALTTAVFRRAERRAVRSLILVCLAVVGFALPYGLVRSRVYRPAGTYYLHAEWEKVLPLSEGTYIVHPRYLRRMPVRIAGFALFPLALAAVKRRRWALYAASGIALPPLVMFNPLLVPALAGRFSLTFVSRALVLFPSAEICAAVGAGVVLPELLAWWRRSPRGRRPALVGAAAILGALGMGAPRILEWLKLHKGVLTPAMALGVGLLIAAAVAMTVRAAWSRGERWPPWNPFRHPPVPDLSMGVIGALSALACLSALPALAREYQDPAVFLTFGQASRPGGLMGYLKALPDPAVVLAEEAISPKIPALTGKFVVATAYSHDPVADWEDRQALVRETLSGRGPWEAVAPGLARYGVDYVVTATTRDPGQGPRLLEGNPEKARRCFEGDGYTVWRIRK